MCLNDSPQIYQQVFTAILSVKLVVGLPFLLVSQLRFNWLIIDSDIIASSPCHNCPIGQCQSTNKVANGSRMQTCILCLAVFSVWLDSGAECWFYCH